MELSLKHIPCPAGKNCTAFRCIFGHEDDQAASRATQEVVSRSSELQNAQRSSASQAVPRKRARTDVVQPSPPSENSHRSDGAGHKPLVPQDEEMDKGSTARLQSANRPLTAPDLMREPDKAKKRSYASMSTPPSSFMSRTSSKQPQTPPRRKLEPIPPKKSESLNPRLLKSSPASHEIRLKLLRMLYLEFVRLNSELKKLATGDDGKLVLQDQDLITRALDEEQDTAVQKAAIYTNVMKNKVMQYKKMKLAQWKAQRAEERKKELQREQPNGGNPGGIEIVTGLSPAQEIQIAKQLLTRVDGLTQHGYVPTVPSPEAIQKAREGVEASKGWEKCDRCQQRFQVFPGRRAEDGALTSGGSCTFHWGKAYVASKAAGDRTRQPKRYICCGQEVGDSVGCFTQSHHVFKTTDSKRLASVLNFAETPENTLPPTDRAVCFDCEMGYTVYGLELLRLTATSWPTGEELLDVLVRPLGEILDLNSRYSGVWPEDLAKAEPWTIDEAAVPPNTSDTYGSEVDEIKPTKKKLKIVSSPEVARDLLFSLISPTTPLIGHGLENDLNAVRIVHPTLIDTVLLYPHKMGLPYRNGLKALMDIHLGRKIQQDTGPKMLGHDSAEDARAAGDLVRLKVREEWKDMQRMGWKFVEGELMAPGTGELTEKFLES